MKRTMILLGCMSLGLAHAQQQGRAHAQHNGAQWRVGINTTKPVATMEISKVDGIPATQVQGFLLPHLSQTERNAMEKEAMENGLMIFNTTKNCIEWWNGTNWQCTDGRYQDEHGDDFNPVKSFTGTYTHPITTQSFTRNNCVAPQTGTTVSYTSQAITKTYVSNISQEDANEQARQQALAEFNQLGQTFANTNGHCEAPLPETTAITLPAGITINNGQRIIASIYDTDYLPYSAPTSLASWSNAGPIAADGAADKTIDVQGKVTTTGLNVAIPMYATSSGTLPAYKTYINIPAERTQDGQARVLELSWASQAFTTSTRAIKATIKALDGDLNVKKLDLVGGLGSDYKGLELGTFVMPQSATDGNVPANYKGKYELRVISGIPDKNFANETIVKGESKGYLHQFIYLPVQGPDGKMWLNNNLGADYANINSPHFNPAKQAESITDEKAFGSVFQYYNNVMGHELVTWTAAWSKTELNPTLRIDYYEMKRRRDNGDVRYNYCPDGWTLPRGIEGTKLDWSTDTLKLTLSTHQSRGYYHSFDSSYRGPGMVSVSEQSSTEYHMGSWADYHNDPINFNWTTGSIRCVAIK